MDGGDMVELLLGALFGSIEPILPLLVAGFVAAVVMSFPMPGRGPRSRRRDPWRGFRWGARSEVLDRAGGRCEGGFFFAWGRCSALATEVDHVYPWSKGGPTVASNGQALCSHHNRRKSHMTPPWWYIRGLEKRRRRYFPDGVDVRVFAVMSEAERARRERWLAKRR